MEVLVRKPPVFTVEPEPLYQRKVGPTLKYPSEYPQNMDFTSKFSIIILIR